MCLVLFWRMGILLVRLVVLYKKSLLVFGGPISEVFFLVFFCRRRGGEMDDAEGFINGGFPFF